MNHTIQILWSGGWDSSFRILQGLIQEKRSIQPYYVYDHRRKSTSWEIEAIRSISRGLKEKFPDSFSLLKPVRIINKSRLKKDSQTRKWYEELNSKYHLGIQYEWFARICRQYNITDLEVGFIKHPDGMNQPFNELLEANIIHENGMHRLKENPTDPALRLMENFSFPIIHLTKEEMGKQAGAGGYYSLLAASWYCYQPDRNGMPCGTCKPCTIAGKSGYQHTFSPESHQPVKPFRFPLFRKNGWLSTGI